ncbi:hypothetical protein ACP4OV_027159 [Aristida adscensionis]
MSYIVDINEEERLKGKTVEVGRAHFETKHIFPNSVCSVPPIELFKDGVITEEEEIMHVPAVQHKIPKPSGNIDIEFDSGLYEPTHLYPDIKE